MEIISVGSSSSGNAYIIKADGHVIILDVGLTARSINEALAELGVKPEDVDAVLITHEHADHVKSIRAVARKCSNATVLQAAAPYFIPRRSLTWRKAGYALWAREK